MRKVQGENEHSSGKEDRSIPNVFSSLSALQTRAQSLGAMLNALKRRSLHHSPYPFSRAKRNNDWLLKDPAKLKLLMDAFNQHPAHQDIERPGYVRDLLCWNQASTRPSLWPEDGTEMVLVKDGPFFSMTEWIASELEFNRGLVLDWSQADKSEGLSDFPDEVRSVFEAIAGSRVAKPACFPKISTNLLRDQKLTGYKAFKCSRLYILHTSAFRKPGTEWQRLMCERVENKLVVLRHYSGTTGGKLLYDTEIWSAIRSHLDISEPKVMSVRSISKDWAF